MTGSLKLKVQIAEYVATKIHDKSWISVKENKRKEQCRA